MNEALSKTAIEFQEQDLDCLLYCEDTLDVYESVEDFWEEWYPFDEDGYVYAPPQRLWATKKPKVELEEVADLIIDSVCERLDCEELKDCFDADKLQVLIDNYVYEQFDNVCVPDYSRYVVISENEEYQEDLGYEDVQAD